MLGILASIIDGVLVGLVYGLAAMGLTLIWGVMDVINLTHGTMIVAGMMGLYLLVDRARHIALSHFTAGPDRRFFCRRRAVLGRHSPHGRSAAADEPAVDVLDQSHPDRHWHRRLGHRPVQCRTVAAGSHHRPLHVSRRAYFRRRAGGGDRRSALLCLHYTRTGKAMRAVANNREAAELVGIPDDAALGHLGRRRRGACRRVRRADRHAVSLHHTFRRRLSAQEFHRHRARRLRQSGRRAPGRYRARSAGRRWSRRSCR